MEGSTVNRATPFCVVLGTKLNIVCEGDKTENTNPPVCPLPFMILATKVLTRTKEWLKSGQKINNKNRCSRRSTRKYPINESENLCHEGL